MNNKKLREIEEKVEQAALEPLHASPELILQMRQQALSDYKKYSEEEEEKKQKKKRKAEIKKGFFRRMVVVNAVTVAFLVVTFCYSVFFPMAMSSADSFVKRVAIWINDQLHLNLEIPVPTTDDFNIQFNGEKHFVNADDAFKSTGFPIISFKDNPLIHLTDIDIGLENGLSPVINTKYESDLGTIIISTRELFDNTGVLVNEDTVTSLHTEIGEIFIWPSENSTRALLCFDSYVVNFYSMLPIDSFINCCSFLTCIN